MRQFFSILTLSTTVALAANALEASILGFDTYPRGQSQEVQLVSDETAQRLLELRMQNPTASTIGKSDEETVKLLDKFGGQPTPLFADLPNREGAGGILFILEGIDPDAYTSIKTNFPTDIAISHDSSSYLSDSFLGSLVGSGDRNEMAQININHCVFDAGGESENKDSERTADCFLENSTTGILPGASRKQLIAGANTLKSWAHSQTLNFVERISFKSHNGPDASTVTTALLESFFHDLHDLSIEGIPVTAVLQPKSDGRQNTDHMIVPRKLREAPSTGNSQSQMIASEKQGSLPMSFAPVCYASESSCNDATNSCSGHGLCEKKTGPADEPANNNCYVCKCKETSVTKEDGSVQKIRWGGAACQKRDISSPFFLIWSVSLLAAAATTAAIAMLYHVGQDELPGVIGAGVGGSRAQK